MSEERVRNGPWPELSPTPPPIPKIGPNASAVELARAYMAVALGYQDRIPKIVEAIHWLHGAVIGARAESERARDIASELKDSINSLKVAVERLTVTDIVETRVKQISGHDLSEDLARDRSRDSERVQKEVDKAIKLREGELAQRTLEEQRKTQRTIIAGVITSIILAVLAFIAGRLLK